MPIYEFKCQKCEDLFELLLMGDDKAVELKCPHCGSGDFQKIMSHTSYAMGTGAQQRQGSSTQTRSCSSGSCATYTIPGPD